MPTGNAQSYVGTPKKSNTSSGSTPGEWGNVKTGNYSAGPKKSGKSGMSYGKKGDMDY